MRTFNIDTSLGSSSSDNVNIGTLPSTIDLGSKFIMISSSFPCAIFPFGNQIRTIFSGVGIISTMCTPWSSWKWKISCKMPFLITVVAMNWSSYSSLSTPDISSTSVASSKPLRSFIDSKCGTIQSIGESIQSSTLVGSMSR
jgi:hypothetical protein